MICITVAGTWGFWRPLDWWRLESNWRKIALSKGLQPPNLSGKDRVRWSTVIDGVWGKNTSWTEGGTQLHKFIVEKIPKNQTYCIVAHSHGGQVATRAVSLLEDHFPIKLLTIATPYRYDWTSYYRSTRQSPTKWYHIYSSAPFWDIFNYDYWHRLGSLFDGKIGWTLEMPDADYNYGVWRNHRALTLTSVWNKYRLWDLLDEESN